MKNGLRETARRGRGKRRTPPRSQRRQPPTSRDRRGRQHTLVDRRRSPLVDSATNTTTTSIRTKCLEAPSSKRVRYPVLWSYRSSSRNRRSPVRFYFYHRRCPSAHPRRGFFKPFLPRSKPPRSLPTGPQRLVRNTSRGSAGYPK